jgi:hypothetical protein
VDIEGTAKFPGSMWLIIRPSGGFVYRVIGWKRIKKLFVQLSVYQLLNTGTGKCSHFLYRLRKTTKEDRRASRQILKCYLLNKITSVLYR